MLTSASFERLEVQEIFEFFLVLLLGLFLLGELHFPARVFQHVSDVVRAGLSRSPCSARSLRRNWSISAGVHFWTPISRAVSRIIVFLRFQFIASSCFAFAGSALRRARSWACGGGGGGSAGRPCQQTAILGHILVVFRQRRAEKMSALCVGHKIEIIGLRGLQRGAQRASPGLPMGPGGRPPCYRCCTANRNADPCPSGCPCIRPTCSSA